MERVCGSYNVSEIINVDLSVFIPIHGVDQNLKVFIGDLMISEFAQNIAQNPNVDESGIVRIEYRFKGFLDGIKMSEFVVAEDGVQIIDAQSRSIVHEHLVPRRQSQK